MPPTFVQRIALGLLTLASLTWLLWPDEHWSWEPEPTVAFLSALVIWLGREIWAEVGPPSRSVAEQTSEEKTQPHPNDVAIARSFLAFFDDHMERFLRDHDLSTSYLEATQAAIFAAYESWQGPRWEYEDLQLKEEFDWFRRLLSEFANGLAIHFEPIHSGHRVRLIVPPEERDFYSDETRMKVDRINALATSMYEVGQANVRLLRKKMPALFSSA